MGEDLGRFLADEPIKARQVSAAERYWRWARRNPVIATLGGVLTAVLVVATIASMLAASHFRSLAASEKRANDQSRASQSAAIEAQHQAVSERDHSQRLSAGLTLEKGLALAEQGQADHGLHWMLEALKTAPEGDDAFRRVARWNLGAWLGQVHQPLTINELHEFPGALWFAPDGKAFAAGVVRSPGPQSSPVSLIDPATGRKIAIFRGCYFPIALTPDGQRLVATSATSDRVLAIDLASGRELWSAPAGPGMSRAMVISPDGSSVLMNRYDVLTNRYDRSTGSGLLLSWDAATGRQLRAPIPIGQSFALAPDGRTLATEHIENGRAFIDLLEWPSGRKIATWRASASDVHQLSINPDGRTLFEYAIEGNPGNANSHLGRIWDLRTRQPMSPILHRAAHIRYTPAGDRALTSAGGAFVVRDAATGRPRGTGPPVTGLAVDSPWQEVHPDGRTVISVCETTASLWRISADADPAPDRNSGEPATRAGGESGHQTRPTDLFWAGLRSDGRLALALARGPAERELVRLSYPVTGRPIGLPARHFPGWNVRALALSPDGGRFATGSNPPEVAGEVRLWDVATGRPVLRPMPHTNYVSALAFQPDGKVLAAGDFNGLVRFWDTATGQEIGRPIPQKEIVVSLAYSPDGKVLAVGLAPDRTNEPGTRLWDVRTRQPIGGRLPNNGRVDRIVFRPDSGACIAGNMVWSRLWDVARGEAIGEPVVDETVAGFRPDGQAFLTLGRDRSVKLRSATMGAVLGRLITLPATGTCGVFRGDGGLVAVGCEDGTVRLCDPATAQPVGPPRFMRHAVHHVAFTFDGRSIAAIDEFGESRTWPVPEPIQGSRLDDVALRIEARTGLRMEAGLSISRLDSAAWQGRLEQLAQLDPAAARPDDDPSWHEPMIREAEQNGSAFAAIWHLDRLIAARAGDWFLYARRARAKSTLDQYDKAAADYQLAERLGSRDQVLDFQTHCVIDCTKTERWAEALWYLDRLIAARPGDWTLREDRAAVYGKLGRDADREAELARVFEMGADAGLVIPRAEQLGRDGRWPEAAALLARCGRRGPLGQLLAQAWAIACLKAGDRSGYREACATVLARNGPEPTVVWDEINAASVLALGPRGLDDYRMAMAWFEKRLSAIPAPPPFYRHFFSSALAGLLLRAGRLDEAITRLNEGLAASKEPEIPNDWALLAMAHGRKGELAAARRWLDRLRAWRPESTATFWDLQEVALLRDEPERLLLDAAFPRDPFAASGP
jgi:WD40 repeat protein/tetratricopeptide (TPR) repeat protein